MSQIILIQNSPTQKPAATKYQAGGASYYTFSTILLIRFLTQEIPFSDVSHTFEFIFSEMYALIPMNKLLNYQPVATNSIDAIVCNPL